MSALRLYSSGIVVYIAEDVDETTSKYDVLCFFESKTVAVVIQQFTQMNSRELSR